jgi:CrcB protein
MSRSPRFAKNLTSVRRRISGRPAVTAVALGGLVGSAARVGIGMLAGSGDSGFPAGIVVVNLVGSFFLGFYLARRERSVSRPASMQFWAIGVFGSFTTFSAFSVELVELLAAGRLLGSIAYVGISVIGGLVVAMAGQRIGAGIR